MEPAILHFIRPAWLWSLPVAALLPFAWRYLRRPSGDWARICDAHLLRWLSADDPTRPRRRAGTWAAAALLVLAGLALAGPSWQRLPDPSFTARDARVLVVDLSASMLAEDLKPNRLVRMRFRLSDLLGQTREGQVGLVAYAGDAYVVSPLTNDMNTIANLLPALHPDIMPVAGSRAQRGLELAAELLERAGAARGEILLVTDSADAADAETAGALYRRGIATSVMAVGTRDGAPIPSGTGFVKDAAGNVVIARLQLDPLARVAAAGGGVLTRLDAPPADVVPWRSAEGGAFARRDDGLEERWRDAGPWMLLLILPFAALGFRRGLLFQLALCLLPGLMMSPPAQAGWWQDLWQRRDQQAQAALREQRPAEAAGLARDPAISAEGWYRAGEYGLASERWGGQNTANAHYNRGNALALAGEYDAALAAYDEALARAPGMEDAEFNREVVERLKQQQQQEQDQAGEQSESSAEQSPDGQQSPQQGEGEADQEEQPGEEAQGENDAESNQQALAQAWSEEDAQAMEQWLRRIPDDPGGLLRRKFRSQHLQRGAPADEERSW